MILIDDTPDICQDTANYPKNPPCRNMDRLYDDFKGKLIVLEGIDGSGKTTQRKLLFKKLNVLIQVFIPLNNQLLYIMLYKKENGKIMILIQACFCFWLVLLIH